MKAFDIYKRAMRLLGYGDILNDEALRQRFEEQSAELISQIAADLHIQFPLYQMSLKPTHSRLKRLPAALQCLYP